MLASIRALVEQQPLEEDYSKLKYVSSSFLKSLSLWINAEGHNGN